ncbi:MAG: transposase [Desulforhopalus sp.]|jgi:transposase
MSKPSKTLPDDPEELKRIILETERRYEKENELLREQIRLLQAQMFGKKSEKGSADSGAVQIPLFDMPEPEAPPEADAVEILKHKREKPAETSFQMLYLGKKLSTT